MKQQDKQKIQYQVKAAKHAQRVVGRLIGSATDVNKNSRKGFHKVTEIFLTNLIYYF